MEIGLVGVIVGLAVLVLLVLLVVFLISRRRRRRRYLEGRRERSREEFGSEYDRTARECGSEQDAERELRQRRSRLERQVRPLSEESRGRYRERWQEVERIFVDSPERSVEIADRTVADLLEEINLVSDAAQSDEETQRSLGVLYSDVADDYREARRIRAGVVGRSAGGSGGSDSNESGEATSGAGTDATEQMREAVRRYRSVYERLLEG